MTLRERRLRVLHCPHDVGGQSSCLAAAERSLGIDSRCVTLSPSPFGYGGATSMTKPGAPPVLVESARLRVFFEALHWADVVHFSFGSTIAPTNTGPSPRPATTLSRRLARTGYRSLTRLTWGRDLALLARRGKGMVVTFQGDDIRPTEGHPAGVDLDLDQDARKRTLVDLFDTRVDAMFAVNPDLLRHLPGRAQFLPYANHDIRGVTPQPLGLHSGLRVAHAPTNRSVKGTAAVVHAVDALRAEGVDIELDLIEGVSNAVALQRIAQSDVLVDQLRIGWYGGVAVEAMALGRPVIARLDADDLSFIDPEMRAAIPVIDADPQRLIAVLRHLAAMPTADRQQLAESSRAYVERWHDPVTIAGGLIDVYHRAVQR